MSTVTVNNAGFSSYGTTAFDNVDAIQFAAPGDALAQFNGDFNGTPPHILSTTTVTGDSHVNQIQFLNAPTIDISGFTFTNWTEGTDVVSLLGSGNADTLIGSSIGA
jgi:hypothetical protein